MPTFPHFENFTARLRNGRRPSSRKRIWLPLAAIPILLTSQAIAQTLGQTDSSIDWGTVSTAIEGDSGFGTLVSEDLGNSTWTIDGHQGGQRFGDNLFHRFVQFDLGLGDTALFTGDPAANVVSHITGSDASKMNGNIKSEISGAHFYFLNPNGIFFGPETEVNVPAAFHLSSAEDGSFANGMRLVATDGSAPSLRVANVAEFGFLGGTIGLDGTLLFFGDSAPIGGEISIRAAELELKGGSKILGVNHSAKLNASGQLSLSGQDANSLGSGIEVVNLDPTTTASLRLTANSIKMSDGAYLLTQVTGGSCAGEQCAGLIDIHVETSLTLAGTSADESDRSYTDQRFPGKNIPLSLGKGSADIFTYQENSEAGVGAIALDVPLTQLRDGAQISTLKQNPDAPNAAPLDSGQVESPPDSVIIDAEAETPDVVAVIIPPRDTTDATAGITLSRVDGPFVDSDLAPARVEVVSDVSLDFEAEPAVAEEEQGSTARASATPADEESAAEESQQASTAGEADAAADEESEGESSGPSGVAPYMNVSARTALALAECGSESENTEAGSFRVKRWPGLPLSSENPLVATSSLGGDTGGTGRAASQSPAGLRRAERQAAAAGDRAGQGDALRQLGELQQNAGAFVESQIPLEGALALARAAGDPQREAAALGGLGNAQVALGEFKTAEKFLTQAIELAGQGSGVDAASRSALSASLLNNLGNQRSISGRAKSALAAYQRSSDAAREADRPLLAAQAEANAARTALRLGDRDRTRRAIRAARKALAEADLTPAEETAPRIHLAQTEASLAGEDPESRNEALLAAHSDLVRASATAEQGGDLRTASQALGHLGALYAQEGERAGEALYLTGRALQFAEKSQSTDLVARWYAQSARLDWGAGRTEAALASYRRAVEALNDARPEASVSYGSADLAFRRAVEPIYLGLVDLLLQSSGADPSPEAQQSHLAEAREVIERWKVAELRNYFRDGCAAEVEPRSIDTLDPRAAIVYPIVLPDRLELLVGRASGITRHALAIDQAEFEGEVSRFRNYLSKRTTRQYKRPAKKLYEWLVAPYVSGLEAEGIDTLVFVPSGILRTVPMAALHDGEGFLLERFAVAITPSLNLLAPKALVPGEAQVLLAGLSEAVQGFPALPSVPSELAAIEKLYGGDVLLNREFGFESLRQSLRNKPPGMVHIASHAEFSGDPDSSFVLTHGDRLSMEQLSGLLRAGRVDDEPVELLMLSACETAVGDERAALGLAGVAIRAGARSAMGSLWTVSDEATAALVVGFYEALGVPEMSKARALQQAQQNLLADARFKHPFYWAPFMVINNWL